MKRMIPILLFAACASSTQVTDVYREPAAGRVAFQKVAAIALVEDPAVRRAAEDEMVKHLRGKGVASYTVLAPEDEKNAAAVVAKLQSLGIDGAVTMRLLSRGDEPIDVQGNIPDSYKAFTGYYGSGPRTNAGWEEVIRVETEIYSVAENKLLWSGATKTFEAKDARSVVESVSKSVADELRKTNLRD